MARVSFTRMRRLIVLSLGVCNKWSVRHEFSGAF